MTAAHSLTWPHHEGPWTVDDVLTMPEGNNRCELVDGALIVSPPPSPAHQRRSGRLYRIMEDAAVASATPVVVIEAVGVQLAEQMLIPDLVVVRENAASLAQPLLAAGDVLLAAEIVSRGSAVRDRTEKPYLYAEAGIRHFWRIETTPYRGGHKPLPVVLRYELDGDGDYRSAGAVGAGERCTVTEPFPCTFDPAELTG